MVKDQHPEATKEAVASVLPVWLEAFKVLLNIDPKIDVANKDNWDGLAIRIQVFKVANNISSHSHSAHQAIDSQYHLCLLSSIIDAIPCGFPISLSHAFANPSLHV